MHLYCWTVFFTLNKLHGLFVLMLFLWYVRLSSTTFLNEASASLLPKGFREKCGEVFCHVYASPGNVNISPQEETLVYPLFLIDEQQGDLLIVFSFAFSVLFILIFFIIINFNSLSGNHCHEIFRRHHSHSTAVYLDIRIIFNTKLLGIEVERGL